MRLVKGSGPCRGACTTDCPAMGTNTAGARCVGGWVLTQNIGAGSFAVVWKARHAVTGQIVAIKEISTDKLNKKLRQSLETEVSILKQITHRNIVQLLEVIEVRHKPSLLSRHLLPYCLVESIRPGIPPTEGSTSLRYRRSFTECMWSC